MARWLAFLLAALVLSASPGAADVERLSGSWRGVELEAYVGRSPLAAGDIELAVRPEPTGLRLAFRTLDGERIEVALVPGEAPGVFEVPRQRGGWLGRFFSPGTGNPLRGEQLLWARIDGPELVVYSLKLGRGGDFALDRYAYTVDHGQLDMIASRRGGDGEQLRLHGRLARGQG